MKRFVMASVLLVLLSSVLVAQDALALYRDRRYEEAISITLKEIESNKSNMDSYSVLGWSLNNLKRYGEAVEWARKAYAINRGDHRIIGILAEGYLGLKQDANALEFYQRFISQGLTIPGWDPRYLRDAYRDVAEIHFRFKEYHKADIAFTTAISYDKGKSAFDPVRASRLYSRLGLARENAGEKEAARMAYQTALGKDAQNADAKSGFERVK